MAGKFVSSPSRAILEGQGTIRFQVIDSGIPIPADQHARIFETFAQVESAESLSDEARGWGFRSCAASPI